MCVPLAVDANGWNVNIFCFFLLILVTRCFQTCLGVNRKLPPFPNIGSKKFNQKQDNPKHKNPLAKVNPASIWSRVIEYGEEPATSGVGIRISQVGRCSENASK